MVIISLVPLHINNCICSLVSHNMQFNSSYSLVNKLSHFGSNLVKDSKTANSVPFCLVCWAVFTDGIVDVQYSTLKIWEKITTFNKSVYNFHYWKQVRS